MNIKSTRRRGIRARFRDLPLFGKLLVPFLALMLLLGGLGGYLIVRDLSSRAETALNQDLSRRSLEVRSLLRDRELSLLESANFAANLEGIADAVGIKDRAAIVERLRSVLALKTRVNLIVAADKAGLGLVEYLRPAGGAKPQRKTGTDWSTVPFVRQALADPRGAKFGGFFPPAFGGGRTMLSVAGAICSRIDPCTPVGVAVVGIGADELAAEAATKLATAAPDSRSGVTFYDAAGRPVASTGLDGASQAGTDLSRAGLVRRTGRSGAQEIATLFAPLDVQGMRQGTIAVSAPTAKAFASVRGAGVRLALVLLAGLVGIVAIGIVLTRFILSQVRPLVATNRALGSGDLSARAPVLGRDELGELALGVNQMAEHLEANVETLELRVQQRTEEVRRLLRERTEFFAALSHEFRTPLAVILRQADLLLDPRTKKTGRWASQSGSMLKDSGQQLLLLINDILDLAKAEAGGLDMNLEEVRLAEAVNELRRTISGLAKGSGLSMSIKVPTDLPAVRADRARLREIILNLVDNAVKYTPEGGRVELSAAARNGNVVVSVSDTGVGIPAEARENMFEPFYRVKGIAAQRGQASSGLGLAITRRLVEAQGGKINYQSEAGAGSTFTFTLTLA